MEDAREKGSLLTCHERIVTTCTLGVAGKCEEVS